VQFLQTFVTSSLLCPEILINTLFSHTFNSCSSGVISDQFSHLCNSTERIRVSCVLIFRFLDEPEIRRV
jgi:hypothetical protein